MPFDGRSFEHAPQTPAGQILARATQLLEKGWVRGVQRYGDRYCAIGAINKAAAQLGLTADFDANAAMTLAPCQGAVAAVFRANDCPMTERAKLAARDTLFDGKAHAVADWNNEADQETVVAGFKKALALVEAEAACARS